MASMSCWRPLPGALRCASLHRAGRGTIWRGSSVPIGRGTGQPLLSQRSAQDGFLTGIGSRCLASEAAEEPATASNWKHKAGFVAVAVVGLGGAAWAVAPWFWSADTSRALHGPNKDKDAFANKDEYKKGRGAVMPISDDIFDYQDNLFVFFLDKAEEVLDRREEMDRIIRPLLNEDSLRRLKFFHNVRSETDPAVPQGEAALGEEAAGKKPLKVVMYKGQRKVVINVADEIPLKEILEFYTPVSEVLSNAAGQLNKEQLVQRVSGINFREEVILPSSPERWVLVQMYEDTCFLCFLMRPFVNSLAVLLQEQGMPITIRRLNVQENDFPDGCPVARGTPTFLLYRGPKIPGVKWDEFKPKDLVEKLIKELPTMDDSIYTKMEEYQELVSNRFRLFTQIVFWTVELSKIQTLVSAPNALAAKPPGPGNQKEKEETDFNTVVAQMMSRDMKRTDGIFDNLKHLQVEVDEVEHDCAVLGLMLGETLLKRENAAA